MMLVNILQVAMDIVLMAGRVFILLLNIHRLPLEEAVLVLSVSASFVAAAIGYINKEYSAFDTLFSKWMLPALFNPVLVYLMALFSESARRTFNNTVSYAPGLAFFSPLGVASFVLLLDIFVAHSWLDVFAAFRLYIKKLYEFPSGLTAKSTHSHIHTPTVRYTAKPAKEPRRVSTSQSTSTLQSTSAQTTVPEQGPVERQKPLPRPSPPRLPVPADAETKVLISRRSRLPEE